MILNSGNGGKPGRLTYRIAVGMGMWYLNRFAVRQINVDNKQRFLSLISLEDGGGGGGGGAAIYRYGLLQTRKCFLDFLNEVFFASLSPINQ